MRRARYAGGCCVGEADAGDSSRRLIVVAPVWMEGQASPAAERSVRTGDGKMVTGRHSTFLVIINEENLGRGRPPTRLFVTAGDGSDAGGYRDSCEDRGHSNGPATHCTVTGPSFNARPIYARVATKTRSTPAPVC